MTLYSKILGIILVSAAITGCSGDPQIPDGKSLDPKTGALIDDNSSTVWDLFRSPDANTDVKVSKYIWNASLETLSFLPVESADPFTGVIVMGWGRAPGSSQVYRATVFIKDPALDARSLTLSLQRRSGSGSVPASAEAVRQIENAILTRARQLRVADSKL
jgi:hypothetical protein